MRVEFGLLFLVFYFYMVIIYGKKGDTPGRMARQGVSERSDLHAQRSPPTRCAPARLTMGSHVGIAALVTEGATPRNLALAQATRGLGL